MNSVIFIRHGQSLANIDCDMYTLPDVFIILTREGIDQCLRLSQNIDTHTDEDQYGIHTTVISSRHQRAFLTAQMVMHKHKYPITQDARLNEQITELDGTPKEPESHIRAKVLSLIEHHHGSLILFTHGNLMAIVDPNLPAPKNCEVRKYEREEVIALLKTNMQR